MSFQKSLKLVQQLEVEREVAFATARNNRRWWDSYQGQGNLALDFCLESNLHGLKYIGQRNRHWAERLFWLLAFLTAVVAGFFLMNQIWGKYRITPVITVFQAKETRIDSIPFPAITICNSNNVLKKKAKEYIGKARDNPKDDVAFNELYLMDHICRGSGITFTDRLNFSQEDDKETHEVLGGGHESKQLNDAGRPFREVILDVSQRCSDMILLCMWLDEIHNCSDLFDEVETDFGYCCAFNLVPSSLLLLFKNDSRYLKPNLHEWKDLELSTDSLIVPDGVQIDTRPKHPEYQHRAGRSSGLSVLLDPDLDSYFCSNTDSGGFITSAHLTLDFPRVADFGHAIRPGCETFLQIRPEVIVADPSIAGISLENRNCYFGTEYSLKYYRYYTISNCEDECIANLTFSQCGCKQYYMPRDDKQPLCGHDQFNCTETVRKTLLTEGTHNECVVCLPTCTQIKYQTVSSYLHLRQDVPLWKYQNGTEADWKDHNVSILHVFFSVDSTHPELRTQYYGVIELLSSFGGLLSLCLGFSALSLLEILYFLTLRAFCQSKRGRRIGKNMNGRKISEWIKSKFKRQNANISNEGHPYFGNTEQLKGDLGFFTRHPNTYVNGLRGFILQREFEDAKNNGSSTITTRNLDLTY